MHTLDQRYPPFAPRRSKYGARKTIVDGITFASAAEARRYGELKLLMRAGKIRQLAIQPDFPIKIRGKLVCTYIADFSYWEEDTANSSEKFVVEDTKGVLTPVYRLKRKMVEAAYGITITEIRT